MTDDSGTVSTPSLGGGRSFARYFFGFALSFGGHPSQQVQTLLPSTSTGTGCPIEPSFAFVTGQTFWSATVMPARWAEWPDGSGAASLSRNIGVSATGVLMVTVANIPGRSFCSLLSRS